MKVTHCFQMLMKFPLRMNRIFGPPASENVFIHFQGGGEGFSVDILSCFARLQLAQFKLMIPFEILHSI